MLYSVLSVAVFGICPTNGFRVYGAGLSSGYGSIEITATPPAKLIGKLNPEGALIKKSSPGKGGVAFVPLYGARASAPDTEVKVPVLIGVPPETAQPSYLQPAGNVGNVNVAEGPEGSKNQIPLFSLVASSSLGVASIYEPAAELKSLPKEAP